MSQVDLRRRPLVAALLKEAPDLIVVAGLGSAAWDITAAGDRDLNFPLWGAMGGAVSVGLGLALAQPSRRVVVVTGDGEMLMGLSALTTIAAMAPKNLAVLVLDNETYGETGGQPTNTARGTDLAAMAKAAGIDQSWTVTKESDAEDALGRIRDDEGPLFCVAKVRFEELALVLPPKDGVILRERLRKALGVVAD
jgi:thiamine pyrophosphate-dependent acetolactate synthase large subunit-like protein